jgi:hypothetical protein
MTARLAALSAALLLLGAARADAATFLGSPNPSAPPDAWACASCAPGTSMGFRQFALRNATVEAPEDGVLVEAAVHLKRLAGSEPPRIAILRPAGDGVELTVAASAPLDVTSPTGSVVELENLHLPVERGDSVGLLFRAGEVDLGVRTRPRPDGAIQWFQAPCSPCGMDGGTGVELLFDAVVEPDVDEDGLGDETQDPDGGGLGEDWEDDWFEDFEAGDELDEDFRAQELATTPRSELPLRLLAVDRLRGGRAALLLRVPRAGRISAQITLPANRRTGAGPFLTIQTGDMRIRRAGRVRLLVTPTPAGARALARRKRARTKVVVAYFPRAAPLELLMRSAQQ